jgi:micrococcal nuclease
MRRIMENKLYFYRAEVVSVYDGDTCRVNIDMGFNTELKNEKIRLSGINAPELKGSEREAGLKSRDFLRGLILGKQIYLETEKDRKGKYGRYLGTIWLKNDAGVYENINEKLVENGFAIHKKY